ncbi:hypothetical protein AB0B27_02030 [Micromonospora rifamycinica]|uniref:hypothetical protein n=1 Tax=Micromonospora rifamycinica TaxID=291594 RepID=UPI0033D3B559
MDPFPSRSSALGHRQDVAGRGDAAETPEQFDQLVEVRGHDPADEVGPDPRMRSDSTANARITLALMASNSRTSKPARSSLSGRAAMVRHRVTAQKFSMISFSGPLAGCLSMMSAMTSRASGRNTVPISWSARSWSGMWMRDSMAKTPSNIPGPNGMFMASA